MKKVFLFILLCGCLALSGTLKAVSYTHLSKLEEIISSFGFLFNNLYMRML